MNRIVRALAATAAIAGLLAGVPVLLWTVGSRLLAGRWPSGSVFDILARPDDGTVLIAFLVAVGAIAWLMVALSLVGELVAVATRRPSTRIALPGFRWSSSVAAALVAAVVGAGPAVAAPALVATAGLDQTAANETAPSKPAPNEPAPSPVAPEVRPVHVVERRDTLWRIAEVALGDPFRWREIYALNVDREQPDGERLTEASVLAVGWRLVLPEDARDTVRVEPGDTLSELAAEHLGDPALAGRLYELNASTPQPDGSALTDPDLIRPGWTLAVPAEGAPGPGPRPAPPEPEAPRRPEPEPDGPVRSTPGTVAPTTTGAPDQQPSADSAEGPWWMVTLAGVSAVVVAGVLASLRLHRRRQLRYRPSRHRIAAPSDDDGRLEWSLQRADTAAATTRSAAQHLDLALRCLTRPGSADQTLPTIRTVRLTDADALVSTNDDGRFPTPFTSAADHAVWSLDADACFR